MGSISNYHVPHLSTIPATFHTLVGAITLQKHAGSTSSGEHVEPSQTSLEDLVT